VIASLCWVFDVFEGRIFVTGMKEAMPSLLPEGILGGHGELLHNANLIRLHDSTSRQPFTSPYLIYSVAQDRIDIRIDLVREIRRRMCQ